MPEIRVEAQSGSWMLLLRWSSPHGAPAPGGPAESSIRVSGPGAFRLRLPGMAPHEPTTLVDQSLDRPLLWEPKRLDILLEHTEGGLPLRLELRDPSQKSNVIDASGKGRALSGALDLDSRVGFLDLRFVRGGAALLELRLDVAPSKLRYRQDFQAMLDEIGNARAGPCFGCCRRPT